MPKKAKKTYFGINKTPCDDFTIFYASFDGSVVAEIGGTPYNTAGAPIFAPSPTGLGLKASERVYYNIPNPTDLLNSSLEFWIYNDGKVGNSIGDYQIIIGDANWTVAVYVGKHSNGNLRVWHNTFGTMCYLPCHNLSIGWHHYRLDFAPLNSGKAYIDGVFSYSISTPPTFMVGGFCYQNTTTSPVYIASDIMISNINRGNVFKTLPKDFIDGKAVIAPAFNPQRKTFTESLMSQYTCELVKADTTERSKHHTVTQATQGTWASGDTVKITGIGGEVISGVIDTDTALAKITSVISGLGTNTLVVTVDNANAITVGDTYNVWTTAGTGGISPFAWTVSAISGNQITFTIGTNSNSTDYYTGGFIVETTASSSAPVVKANISGTVTTITGTWSGLGTNLATFTLGTNATLNTQDLQVEYSLNAPSGQGQIDVYSATLGGEVNGRKLISGTVVFRDDLNGKIAGSLVENPHVVKKTGDSVIHSPYDSSFVEEIQSNIDKIKMLDGTTRSFQVTATGSIPQLNLQWNIIRLIEDKLGMPIPAVDKVAWIKTYVSKITCNAWINGLANGINNAYFSIYGSSWNTPTSTSASTPTQKAYATSTISDKIDANGNVNFLVYTDAVSADGNTATIYLDYAYIDVELTIPSGYDALVPENPRRDDNWRVTSADLKVTNDFSGKVVGDTIANPHIAKYASASSLQVPSAFTAEASANGYGYISTPNGVCYQVTTSVNGQMAQALLQQDVIAEIERKYGKIPVVNKIAFAKAYIDKAYLNVTGYGSSPVGNKLSTSLYKQDTLSLNTSAITITSSTPSTTNYFCTDGNANWKISNLIDANGYAYFVLNADASDGTTPSTINIDYISFDVILKPEAVKFLKYFNDKNRRSNVLLVRKETKEVQTMFPATNEDRIAVWGDVIPPAPLAPSDSVTILTEIPEFLVTDLASAVGDKQGTHQWKNLLAKLLSDKSSLLGQFGYGRTPFSTDSKGVNTGAKVAINSAGFNSGHTTQYGISTIKKPLVGIARYLVMHNGELKLLIVTKYSTDGTMSTGGTLTGLLVPITNRPLVKEPEGVIRSTINPTQWLTPDEEIQGFINDQGTLVVTYQ